MRRDFYTYSLFSLPSRSGSAPLIETSTIVRNADGTPFADNPASDHFAGGATVAD